MKSRGSAAEWGARLGNVTAIVLAFFVFAAAAKAQYTEETAPYGQATQDLAVIQKLFPEAADVGPAEGEPLTAEVFDGAGDLLGYAYETIDVVRSVGFAGQPFLIVVGLGTDAVLRGAVLVHHVEPIVHHGTPDAWFHRFIDQYAGIDVRSAVRVNGESTTTQIGVDGINTATISAMFMNDSIVQSARRVARMKGLYGGEGTPRASLDVETYQPWTWATMIENNALAHLHLSNADVAARFAEQGAKVAFKTPLEPGDETFIDLYAGLATPAAVGQNLVGESRYNRRMATRGVDEQLLIIAGQGRYSFEGISFWRTDIFDRFELIQGDKVHRFTRQEYDSVSFLKDRTAPPLDEIALFLVPASMGFDPLKPWRLDLLVSLEGAEGGFHYTTFSLPYSVPDALVVPAAAAEGPAEMAPETPAWVLAWQDRRVEIAILGAALAVLTAILFFMDPLVKRRRLYAWVRIGFLAFTLVWIGWIAQAQLTILHVISYGQALLSDPSWDFFLIDPLIFIIAAFTLVSLLLWGRGVFCGWLCPFGALQELANKAARAVRVPQIDLPASVNQRLWPVKYLILITLIGLAAYSTDALATASEVEPFKTAITLKFVRAWPFVVYAVALLVASLFIERFFCRFMCPLGGSLAIGGKTRMLDWLRRRPQCGTECRICEASCPVQAIEPSGKINMSECFYCLDCQVDYSDDHKCPPLIARRRRKEGRARVREAARAGAPAAAE